MPENYIFGHFCPNVPKNCDNLNGRHNFFCICRFARLKIFVRGLLLYFQKIQKNLTLVNFSRTCIPPENPYMSNFHVVFHHSRFSGGMQVLLKLTNFKFLKMFWNYNSNPLTNIFNLARRQIQKKLCRPFKFSQFLCKFGQKWPKIQFSGIKMVKNIIFGLVSWNNHNARWKEYTLVNSQKNFFWSWKTSLPTIAP